MAAETRSMLQARAAALGLSTEGTKAEISARIERKRRIPETGRCPYCRFTSINAGVLPAHIKQAHRKEVK